jgi:L-arabinose transport system substrate-binding protein
MMAAPPEARPPVLDIHSEEDSMNWKQLRNLLMVPAMAACCSVSLMAQVKIGFLVKMPEEPWFQTEWKFADQAGKDLGFSVIKIGTPDGEKVLAAIDNLAAQGAKGFVICTPDPKLGPAIAAKAKALNLKVLAVDDRFVSSDGKPMEKVPYLGISAGKIGETVGLASFSEFHARGWKAAETGVIAISSNELQTARERVAGASSALTSKGFSAANIYDSPQKTTDTEGGFNSANVTITQHPNIKNWIVVGLNDETVIGGVRALEGRGFKAANVIGIGIGGAAPAINELKKSTGFVGSVLLAARQHGYDTSKMMFNWITKNQMPPADTRTAGFYIDRKNYVAVLKESGLEDLLK